MSSTHGNSGSVHVSLCRLINSIIAACDSHMISHMISSYRRNRLIMSFLFQVVMNMVAGLTHVLQVDLPPRKATMLIDPELVSYYAIIYNAL